jgi:hypothetical protein
MESGAIGPLTLPIGNSIEPLDSVELALRSSFELRRATQTLGPRPPGPFFTALQRSSRSVRPGFSIRPAYVQSSSGSLASDRLLTLAAASVGRIAFPVVEIVSVFPDSSSATLLRLAWSIPWKHTNAKRSAQRRLHAVRATTWSGREAPVRENLIGAPVPYGSPAERVCRFQRAPRLTFALRGRRHKTALSTMNLS